MTGWVSHHGCHGMIKIYLAHSTAIWLNLCSQKWCHTDCQRPFLWKAITRLHMSSAGDVDPWTFLDLMPKNGEECNLEISTSAKWRLGSDHLMVALRSWHQFEGCTVVTLTPNHCRSPLSLHMLHGVVSKDCQIFRESLHWRG